MRAANQVLILISLIVLAAWCADGAVCPDSCITAVKPVCARDEDGNSRTFSNHCLLNRYNCQRADTYVYVRDGPCLSNAPTKGSVDDPPKKNSQRKETGKK